MIEKPHRKFSELSLPAQAGIRANDQEFSHFVVETFGYFGDYAAFIRDRCGVESRAVLATDKAAALRWRELESNFQAWRIVQSHDINT